MPKKKQGAKHPVSGGASAESTAKKPTKGKEQRYIESFKLCCSAC